MRTLNGCKGNCKNKCGNKHCGCKGGSTKSASATQHQIITEQEKAQGMQQGHKKIGAEDYMTPGIPVAPNSIVMVSPSGYPKKSEVQPTPSRIPIHSSSLGPTALTPFKVPQAASTVVPEQSFMKKVEDNKGLLVAGGSFLAILVIASVINLKRTGKIVGSSNKDKEEAV